MIEMSGEPEPPVRGATEREPDMSLGETLRRDFPIFSEQPELVYYDTAASAMKPAAVLDTLTRFYTSEYSNIHRGVYSLSEQATLSYEDVREKARRFIGAGSTREVIFTSGTTAGLNLVAYSYARANLKPGDEIIVSLLEHHANFVPWQLAADATGAIVRYAGLTPEGTVTCDAIKQLITERTRIVAITALSNGLGVAPPVAEIAAAVHAAGAVLVVDGAQSVLHGATDLALLGADFFAFSGHKLYGPTGVGVLWGREELLESMPPFLAGGDMIRHVSTNGSKFNDLPFRFEAGTPHIAGVIGMGAAIDYVTAIGMDRIAQYESELLRSIEQMLTELPGVRVLGPSFGHAGVVVFTVEGVHPHDVAQLLAASNVAVRAGHHCAQPLLSALGVPATTRVSVGLYNVPSEIEKLRTALLKTISFFRR